MTQDDLELIIKDGLGSRCIIDGILDGTIPIERQAIYLNIIKDEIIRLNRLVNDFMDLAKMESGELKLEYKSFNINELIRNSVIKLESFITQKNINIEADFEEELFVFADKDAIERVLINLIDNAVKFTEVEGTIKLLTYAEKNNIRVVVEDNGYGIEESDIDSIWERFYKSDKSRAKDRTGAGLGLAIVKNIINEHQQNIWVETEKGKGSKFSFTLQKS
jgi:signal transduction histidine kinase